MFKIKNIFIKCLLISLIKSVRPCLVIIFIKSPNFKTNSLHPSGCVSVVGDCRLVLSVRTARETRDTCQDSCAALPSSEHVSHRYRQGAHRVSHKYLGNEKYLLSLTFTSTLPITHRAGEGSVSSEVKTEPRHD